MNSESEPIIAWAGLGRFGLPIATHLIESGYRVEGLVIGQRGRAGANRLSKVGGRLSERRDLLGIDVLILCLPRPDDVVTVLNHFRPSLPDLVLDLTTGSPGVTRKLHGLLIEQGTTLVDAPVSGSIEGALSGDLTVFAGAKPGFTRLDALLRTIGQKVFYFGKAGSGHHAKLVNQLIHLGIMVLIGDALRLARSGDLNLGVVVEALRSSSAQNAMLDRFGNAIVDGDFSPRFTLDLALKDLELIEDVVRDSRIDLRLFQVILNIYRDFAQEGHGWQNFSIVAK